MSVALIIKVKRTHIPEVSFFYPFREKNKEMPKPTADKFAVLGTTETREEFYETILLFQGDNSEHKQQH